MTEIAKMRERAHLLVDEYFDKAGSDGGRMSLYEIEVAGEKQGLDMQRLFTQAMAEQKKTSKSSERKK